jgi:hypothetical protein
MGTTRNEILADYYLRAAGIAVIWIDPDGHIGAHDVASMELPAGRVAYCCPRGAHFVLAYRLQLWKQDQHAAGPDAIGAVLEQLASDGGVGITAHAVATARALEAVATVNGMLDGMKDSGAMKEFNAAFKAARKVDKSIRYFDFLHSKKAALLEQLAMEGAR